MNMEPLTTPQAHPIPKASSNVGTGIALAALTLSMLRAMERHIDWERCVSWRTLLATAWFAWDR
jgi:hypothetical protein